MALTFKDVGLLDNAFDSLNQTLMRNRMMKQEQSRQQQEQQRLEQNEAATQQYRNAELAQRGNQQAILDALAADRLAESQKKDTTAQTNAENKENDLTKRLKQNTIQFHDKQIQEIQDQVAKGTISPQQGTQMIKQGVAKWDDWEKQENPLYSQYSAPDFQLTAKPQKPVETGSQSVRQVQAKDANGNPVFDEKGQPVMMNETNTISKTFGNPSPVPPAPSAQPQTRVKVKSPDGKLFTVPQSQLQDAINQGYSQVE